MTLKCSPQHVLSIVNRLGGGPLIATLEADRGYVIFFAETEGRAFCVEVEADEKWMRRLRRSPNVRYENDRKSFIRLARRLWPDDEHVLDLAALID
jgi:hypothetical protein